MTLTRLAAAVALAGGLAATLPARAADPVITIVEVPTPWYTPAFLIRSKMRDAIPQYERIPGLAWKGFSIAEPSGDFGGIYLWQDAASATAWYSPAWHARVRESRGVDAKLRRFSVLGLRDLAVIPRDDHSAAAATLILYGAPSRDGTAPARDLADPPGLLRQVVLRGADGRPARLDIWASEAAAEAYFTADRRAALGGAQVERFALPILLPTATPATPLAAR